MNSIQLYKKEYEKYKDIDSIPVILNISKKQFNYIWFNGTKANPDKISINLECILLDTEQEIVIGG